MSIRISLQCTYNFMDYLKKKKKTQSWNLVFNKYWWILGMRKALLYIIMLLWKLLHIRDSTFLFICLSGIRAPHALFQIYFIGPAWKLLIQLLLYPMHWFSWNFVGMKDTMCRCACYQEIPILLFFREFSPLNFDLRIFFLIWM